MLTKQEVYDAVSHEIHEREERIQSAFDDLNSAIANDSKSTAGDKHETGRAMIHLEQEKLSQQLSQTKNLREALVQINPEENHSTIQFGSLVASNRGYFFFSIGLGKVKVKNEAVFCLSITTPLGKVLAGKNKGDKVIFNGGIEILEVI